MIRSPACCTSAFVVNSSTQVPHPCISSTHLFALGRFELYGFTPSLLHSNCAGFTAVSCHRRPRHQIPFDTAALKRWYHRPPPFI
jgi:hypothetical protein